MSSGSKHGQTPEENAENGSPPSPETLEEFVAWLYGSRSAIEVIALENAVVADVECSVQNEQGGFVHETIALDSGTWVMVRISDQPPKNTPGGIVAFEREETSGQEDPH